MKTRISGLVVLGVVVLCSINLKQTRAQIPPTPDPVGTTGTGGNGTQPACGCQPKLVSNAVIETLGPDFDVQTITTKLKPENFAADPAVDEWSGDDELYRIANIKAEKLTPTSGSISVTASQGG